MTNIVLVINFFRAARLAGARRRAVRTNFGLIARRTAVRLYNFALVNVLPSLPR